MCFDLVVKAEATPALRFPTDRDGTDSLVGDSHSVFLLGDVDRERR
jgi:hypothetical protein